MTEEEILDIMATQLRDTTPERVLANRSGGEFCVGRTSKGSTIKGYKIESCRKMNSKDKDLAPLLYEYIHYFDKGYIAPHRIDDLPDLIRKRCDENISKRT